MSFPFCHFPCSSFEDIYCRNNTTSQQQETTRGQQGNLVEISPINVISHIGFHRYRVGNGKVIHDILSEEHFDHLKISRGSYT
jgi:hypothetical protein